MTPIAWEALAILLVLGLLIALFLWALLAAIAETPVQERRNPWGFEKRVRQHLGRDA